MSGWAEWLLDHGQADAASIAQATRVLEAAALRPGDTVLDLGAGHGLLTLAAHVARRTQPWPRRVVFPKGEVLRAWGMPDTRAPLPADAIGAITSAVRAELVARAETKRAFARAVIDRGLSDLLVPIGERSASKTKIAWPRGSELAIPDGATLRDARPDRVRR